MPVTPSARKALRNAQAKEARNAVVKAELKRTLKNAKAENMPAVVSAVDKAVKRHLMHANKAARLKSRLSKVLAGNAPVKPVKKKAKAKTESKSTK